MSTVRSNVRSNIKQQNFDFSGEFLLWKPITRGAVCPASGLIHLLTQPSAKSSGALFLSNLEYFDNLHESTHGIPNLFLGSILRRVMKLSEHGFIMSYPFLAEL